MTACALSLILHGALVASILLWTGRPAEMVGSPVLSIYLTSSQLDVDSNSEPATPNYQGLGPSDSSSSSAPAAGADFASPPSLAGSSARIRSDSAAAPSAGQAAPEFPASQPGFDAAAPPFQPAAPLSTPKPNYPILARRRGLEGIVLIELDIDDKGIPKGFKIVPPRSSPLLEESALASLENLFFVPAKSYGRPVSSTLSLKFRFELRDGP